MHLTVKWAVIFGVTAWPIAGFSDESQRCAKEDPLFVLPSGSPKLLCDSQIDWKEVETYEWKYVLPDDAVGLESGNPRIRQEKGGLIIQQADE